MADTPLTSLLNSIQVQGVQSVSAIRAAVNIPPAIMTMPVGTLLSGFIVAKDTRGNAILKTDKGEVILKTPLNLNMNNEVVLRVEGTGEQFKARIVSVNGRTPENAATLPPAIEPAPPPPAQPQSKSTVALSPAMTEETPVVILSTPEKAAPLLKAIFVNPSPLLKEVTKSAMPVPPNALIAPARITPGAIFMVKVSELTSPPAMQTQQPATSIPPVAPSAVPPAPPAAPVVSTITETPTATPSSAAVTQSVSIPITNPAPTVPSLPTGIWSVPATETISIPAPVSTILSGTTKTPAAPVQISNFPANTPTTTITAPQQLSSAPVPIQNIAPPYAHATGLPAANTESRPVIAPPSSQTGLNSPALSPAAPTFDSLFQPPMPLLEESTAAVLRALTDKVMYGRLVGVEKSHEPVVHTPLGALKLQTDIPLPKDHPIRLEIVEIRPSASNPSVSTPATQEASSGISPLPAASSTGSILNTGMTSLFALSAFATATDNPDIKQAVQRVIPQVGPRLGAHILFFISALRGGDINNWLGAETVTMLEKAGQKELLLRLNNEFTTLRTLFTDVPVLPPSAPQSWQMLLLPVIAGQELHHVRMYVKKDRQEKSKTNTSDVSTRFIVEITLPFLGDMQMDGFVKKLHAKTRFDLMVRTHHKLPENMQQGIQQVFKESAEITGFRGNIEFQVVKDFPVQPLAEMEAVAAQSVIA